MFKSKLLTHFVLHLCLAVFGVEHGPNVNRVVTVEEGSDAVLPCSLGSQDLNYALFDWKKEDPNGLDQKDVFLYDAGIHNNNGRDTQHQQFKGRVSHFEDELQHGNASIKIHNTKMEDSGDYSCHFPHLQPVQTFYVQLVVDRILKDRSGSPGAPKPYVKTVNATNDWTQLQCDVRGASTKPEVEWKNSDGKVLHSKEPEVTESEGRFDVTLLITVDQTGLYRCVVTQEDLHHQTYEETFVYISGRKEQPSEIPWWGWLLISGFVGLFCFAFGFVTGAFSQKKSSAGRPMTDSTCTRPASSSRDSHELKEHGQHEPMLEKLSTPETDPYNGEKNEKNILDTPYILDAL